MATEHADQVLLKDDFYRDGFAKLAAVLGALIFVAVLLASASIYLYVKKPKPITFKVYKDWRVVSPVPVNQPYLSSPEVLQWVSDAVRQLFVFNFNDYSKQLENLTPYFTSKGWEIFKDQLNNYANMDEVLNNKMFINGAPGGAPTITSEGLLNNRYSWWIELPVKISYIAIDRRWDQAITLQILVVRVPTLNNLSGVAIENIMIPKRR